MTAPTSTVGEKAAAQSGEDLARKALAWVESMQVEERVRQNPYGMLAAGFGAGYVLGGGLFTATTGRVIQLAIKAAAIPAVQSALLDIAESAVDSALAASTPKAP